jgi:methanogenic corrinoid protein MtbC1
MSDILHQIAICVERGKINLASPYPPDLKGQKGADELTKEAIENGLQANDVLQTGLLAGMSAVGAKFGEGLIFVPDLLMAAKAMQTALKHLRPFFQSGEVKRKGTFVIGTVAGDLHDIGKNLVSMMVEGAGWEVIDLGIDVPSAKFLEVLKSKQVTAVGLSALLTTTMPMMEQTVKEIRDTFPQAKVIVGGAPVSAEFAARIGAHGYAPDPQSTVEFLNKLVA